MRIFLSVLAMAFSLNLSAAGLTIHAAEIGIGKFHRHDNSVHTYEAENAWAPYILPAGQVKLPYVKENSSESVTIFFDTLEGMLKEMVKVAKERNQKVAVLNINAHGLPGGMWFPATTKLMNSFGCMQWKQAANGSDEGNYKQYYSPVSKSDILQMREYSKSGGNVPCVTGTSQWKSVVASIDGMKTVFTENARVNLLSCLVGLGPVGDKFSKELGQVLFANTEGTVKTSINLGLGDWSMPEGMGFWDYINDEQLEKDNKSYPINKKDREQMQKGSVRIASFESGGWSSKVLTDLDFMMLDGSVDSGRVVTEVEADSVGVKPSQIRLPGTALYLPVK